jgi:hypothetical protein
MSNLLNRLPYAVTLDSVTERRRPMGRLERISRFTVRYYPEPAERVIGFHAEDGGQPDYRLGELTRELELIDTPDGPVRGHGITAAVKDGAAVIGVTYTEWLREEEPRPAMDRITLTVSPPPAGISP